MSAGENGVLGDRRGQNLARKVDAEVRRRLQRELEMLASLPEFRLYIGRLVQRCGLKDDLNTSNGSEIQRFAGRRSIAVEVLAEMENVVPGFELQMMTERFRYQSEIEERNRNTPQENDDG